MIFDNRKFPIEQRTESTKLTNNNYAHLRMFNDGLVIDLCLDPGKTFGFLFPSMPIGQVIKLGAIRDLKAKGLIIGETVMRYFVEYKSYSISPLGKSLFEKYKNDLSK